MLTTINESTAEIAEQNTTADRKKRSQFLLRFSPHNIPTSRTAFLAAAEQNVMQGITYA